MKIIIISCTLSQQFQSFLIDLLQNLLSGLILIWIGLKVYKKVKEKQTRIDQLVDFEFQLKEVVNLFKNARTRKTKTLEINSFDGITATHYIRINNECSNLIHLIDLKNIKIDTQYKNDLYMLEFYSKSIMSVLVINDVGLSDMEKIKIITKMDIPEAITFDFESFKNVDYQNYLFFTDAINKRIESGQFLKPYGFFK